MENEKNNIRLIDNCKNTGLDLTSLEFLAKNVVSELAFTVEALSVILVDDDYLKRLHSKYLNEDQYTDVMTFSYGETEVIDGEIYISKDRAKIQAQRYGVNLPDELARLLIHGLLHLKGFDDIEPEGKEAMTKKEDELLEKFW